jgi:CDP-diacylglycerol--serine O-phosphatidyltransferase
MKGPAYFIVSLTPADGMTLGALGIAGAGLLVALDGLLSLAIALMLLAMLVDMLDGAVARRMGWESEFGRYLDSFADVFTYLLLPLFILFQFGMQDALSVTALFAFLAAGFLRLSRFNIIGTVQEAGVEYHLGLQVIWSHLLVVLVFPAWHWLGDAVRFPVAAVLLGMSFLMVRNLKFRKPTQYPALALLILSVASAYALLHFRGVTAP